MFNHTRTAVIVGAAVLSALALTGCTVNINNAPQTTAPAVESSAASQASTSASPAGGSGVVTINQTINDEYLDSTVTVEKATTTWIPAISPMPDVASNEVRMVGIRISTDASNTQYAASVNPADFSLVASDGTSIHCTELTTDGQYLPQSQAILAALGGDMMFTFDVVSGTGEGWFPCLTLPTTDAAFNTPGYTIHYERGAAQTDDGTILPAVTADIPVAA